MMARALVFLVVAVLCLDVVPSPVKGTSKLFANSPRPTPTVASRSLVRPFLTVLPSDHAAAGRDQTSPSDVSPATRAQRPGNAVTEAQANGYAVSGTQTSAGQTQSVTSPSRTADNAESPVGSEPLAHSSAGPTAIADRHGTLKQRIAWCESRGLNVVNPSSGASGFWQFLDGTFEAVTDLPGKASDYPLSVQSEAFDELYAQQGAKPWNASKGCWSK